MDSDIFNRKTESEEAAPPFLFFSFPFSTQHITFFWTSFHDRAKFAVKEWKHGEIGGGKSGKDMFQAAKKKFAGISRNEARHESFLWMFFPSPRYVWWEARWEETGFFSSFSLHFNPWFLLLSPSLSPSLLFLRSSLQDEVKMRRRGR